MYEVCVCVCVCVNMYAYKHTDSHIDRNAWIQSRVCVVRAGESVGVGVDVGVDVGLGVGVNEGVGVYLDTVPRLDELHVTHL